MVEGNGKVLFGNLAPCKNVPKMDLLIYCCIA